MIEGLPYKGIVVPATREFHPDGSLGDVCSIQGGLEAETQQHILRFMRPARPHGEPHVSWWTLIKGDENLRSEAASINRWVSLSEDDEALECLESIARDVNGLGSEFYALCGYAPQPSTTDGYQPRGSSQSEPWPHFHAASLTVNGKNNFNLIETSNPRITNAAAELAILHFQSEFQSFTEFPIQLCWYEDLTGKNHQALKIGTLKEAINLALYSNECGKKAWDNMVNLDEVYKGLKSTIPAELDWLHQVLTQSPSEVKQLFTPGSLIMFNQDSWLVFPYAAGNAGLEMKTGMMLIRPEAIKV